MLSFHSSAEKGVLTSKNEQDLPQF